MSSTPPTFYYSFLYCQVIRGEYSTKNIGCVSQELLIAGKSLEQITKERDTCLKTFSNCLDLVEWLKENIGGR